MKNVRLGDFAEQVKRVVEIIEGEEYRLMGCRLYGKGVYQRDAKTGWEIKAKRMFRVLEDDLVINRIWAQKGSAGIVPKEIAGSVVTNDFPVFEIDKKKAHPKYLSWYLRTEAFQKECAKYSYGTSGRRRLSPSQINNVEIPICDLSLQKQIANRLEVISDQINIIELNLSRIPLLIQYLEMRILSQAFHGELTSKWRMKNNGSIPLIENDGPVWLPSTWSWTQLGEIAEIATGSTPSTKDERNFNGSIPWLTPADLRNLEEKYIGHGRRNITQRGLDSCSARLLPEGAVLFSSRAPIGYVAIALNPIATNQGFKNLILRDGIFNEFVFYYLKASKELVEGRASGTTFLEISAKKFRKIPIPVPPFIEQYEIVKILDEYMRLMLSLKKHSNESLGRVEKLKASILSNVFADIA